MVEIARGSMTSGGSHRTPSGRLAVEASGAQTVRLAIAGSLPTLDQSASRRDHPRNGGASPTNGKRMARRGRETGAPNAEGISPVPTLALRGGLSGLFVDFDHLPALLADNDPAGIRHVTIARWSVLLAAAGFDGRHIDPDEFPTPQPSATLAAEGAWRLAECMGFIETGLLTDSGRDVAALADLDAASRYKALAPMLAVGIESALVGQGGVPIVPLLRRAAQCLTATRNLWARECPGLVPVEIGAIVHWACVDVQRAQILVGDIEINRDLTMRRVGTPDPDAPAGANAERHFERIVEFYLEHPDLGGRVRLSFGEELALARLLAYCGLFREDVLGPGVFWLA